MEWNVQLILQIQILCIVLYIMVRLVNQITECDSWNDIAPASDGAWVTPFTLDPSNPNRIVAGYEEVWESNDGGNSANSLTNGQAGGTIDALRLQNLMEMLFIFPSIMKYL